jgi:Transposase, Mutator family
VHKTASVLAKLPKSQQPKARRALQEIWMAETKAAAELAFDAFVESYALKYERAADCLNQDRDAPLAFYDFPAEHWKHLSPCETFRRDQTTIGNSDPNPARISDVAVSRPDTTSSRPTIWPSGSRQSAIGCVLMSPRPS